MRLHLFDNLFLYLLDMLTYVGGLQHLRGLPDIRVR